MRGAGGEGVVVVVPGLAETEKGEPPDVSRLVARGEAAPAEEVADRVDREGDVVKQEDADAAAPNEAGECALPAADDQIAGEGWQCQAGEHDRNEEAGDQPHALVGDQVLGVAALVGAAGGDEEPARVGVPEAVQCVAPGVVVAGMRGVWVTLLVGELVVFAVIGDPGDHVRFDRHLAQHREQVAHRPRGLEGAVRKQAVKADSDAEPGEHIADREDDDRGHSDVAIPEHPDRAEDGREGKDNAGGVHQLQLERHASPIPQDPPASSSFDGERPLDEGTPNLEPEPQSGIIRSA